MLDLTLKDFERNGEYSYRSIDRYWFENGKVGFFWYRYYLSYHVYQPGWTPDAFETRYTVYLVVDDESIHENHKDARFKEMTCGFCLKSVEKRGLFSEKELEKVLKSALKLKIENKIKVDRYQKILGIVNGGKYYV